MHPAFGRIHLFELPEVWRVEERLRVCDGPLCFFLDTVSGFTARDRQIDLRFFGASGCGAFEIVNQSLIRREPGLFVIEFPHIDVPGIPVSVRVWREPALFFAASPVAVAFSVFRPGIEQAMFFEVSQKPSHLTLGNERPNRRIGFTVNHARIDFKISIRIGQHIEPGILRDRFLPAPCQFVGSPNGVVNYSFWRKNTPRRASSACD